MTLLCLRCKITFSQQTAKRNYKHVLNSSIVPAMNFTHLTPSTNRSSSNTKSFGPPMLTKNHDKYTRNLTFPVQNLLILLLNTRKSRPNKKIYENKKKIEKLKFSSFYFIQPAMTLTTSTGK